MTPYYYVRTQEKVEIALLDMFNNIVVNKYSDLSKPIKKRPYKNVRALMHGTTILR